MNEVLKVFILLKAKKILNKTIQQNFWAFHIFSSVTEFCYFKNLVKLNLLKDDELLFWMISSIIQESIYKVQHC